MDKLIEIFDKKIETVQKFTDFKLEQQRISFQKQFKNMQKINDKLQDKNFRASNWLKNNIQNRLESFSIDQDPSI